MQQRIPEANGASEVTPGTADPRAKARESFAFSVQPELRFPRLNSRSGIPVAIAGALAIRGPGSPTRHAFRFLHFREGLDARECIREGRAVTASAINTIVNQERKGNNR